MSVWLVRIVLATGAVAAEWLIAPEPHFTVAEGIIKAAIFFGVIGGLMAWTWFRR